MRSALAAVALLTLTACKPPARPQAPVAPAAPPLPVLTADVAQTAAPLVLEAIEAVAEVLPPAPPVVAPAEPLVDPWEEVATPFIVRWEVTSPATYDRRYRGVLWPGGASGPTIGIGFDLGYYTRTEINRAWAAHPQVARLESAAGVVGNAARDRVRAGEWRGVQTPFNLAENVFGASTLPSYGNTARRVMRPEVFDDLAPRAQAAWVSTVYNRGGGLTGDSRREMRTIAKECAPKRDYSCMAAQYRAMCRVWQNKPAIRAGLCRRYEATASLVEFGND